MRRRLPPATVGQCGPLHSGSLWTAVRLARARPTPLGTRQCAGEETGGGGRGAKAGGVALKIVEASNGVRTPRLAAPRGAGGGLRETTAFMERTLILGRWRWSVGHSHN